MCPKAKPQDCTAMLTLTFVFVAECNQVRISNTSIRSSQKRKDYYCTNRGKILQFIPFISENILEKQLFIHLNHTHTYRSCIN